MDMAANSQIMSPERREINGQRKTSKGKLTIFLKATRKFLIISTQRTGTSTETHNHILTYIQQHIHTHHCRDLSFSGPAVPSEQEPKLDGKRKIMSSLFTAVKGQ